MPLNYIYNRNRYNAINGYCECEVKFTKFSHNIVSVRAKQRKLSCSPTCSHGLFYIGGKAYIFQKLFPKIRNLVLSSFKIIWATQVISSRISRVHILESLIIQNL
uniref:Uncharacterized protein n=1 Tax=Cacopsylla melanoneura TaxID=428564 RepID=A0A8D8XBM3_9HEMI